MNNNYQLLCPECLQPNGKHRMLGMMLPQGGVALLTVSHRKTIIKAEEYQVECDCGFSMQVQGTVITKVITTLLQPSVEYASV